MLPDPEQYAELYRRVTKKSWFCHYRLHGRCRGCACSCHSGVPTALAQSWPGGVGLSASGHPAHIDGTVGDG